MTIVHRISPPNPGPFATPRPGMRGPYLIRHPLKAAAVATRDAMLRMFSPGPMPVPADPRRILLANWGHLGDVVTTLGLAATLRTRFPNAILDMVVGSWGAPPARASGLFDTLHLIDHHAVNRSDAGRRAKIARYRTSLAAALPAIRSAGYDVAIDCYPFQPPAHPIFQKACIPVRAGFTSGGYGPLLTHPVRWTNASQPIASHYRALLAALWPNDAWTADDLRPCTPSDRLARPADLVAPYIVLHPGAGAAYKDWGIDRWLTLIALLHEYPQTAKYRFVVTGAGAGEVAVARRLADAMSDILDLAGRADWPMFEAVLAHADIVVCPDTVTAHLAARHDTPVLAIFTGANDPQQWGPYSRDGHVMVQDVACTPCNRPGCAAMACIAGTTPDQVFGQMIAILGLPDQR
jgi:ADP-heptose:LPS heptosyltransferase